MELNIIKKKRVLTYDEGTALCGTYIEKMEADVTEACIIVDEDTNEPLLAYLPLEKTLVSDLRKAVLSVEKFGSSGRSSDWDGKSKTFGMAPRKPFHLRESCRPTQLAVEQPEVHAVFTTLADKLDQMLLEITPDVYESNQQFMSSVSDEWKMMDGSSWTSGVINKSAQLPYHRDGFNFDTWSAMPVIRRGMRGGYLDVPEYKFTVACRDGWVLFFPGYLIVHGVTPLEAVDKDGYRFSVVYYALKGMKDCFTYAVETAQGRKKRTSREQDLSDAIEGKKDFKVGVKKKTKK